MVDIANFGGGIGPNFGDDLDTAGGGGGKEGYIHIRNQQRNGKKSLTTIQGIPDKFNYKKILKAFKKNFNCNGSIVEDEEFGNIIQIQGDKRAEVAEFLFFEGIVEREQLKVHG